jgi:hypothetical protein
MPHAIAQTITITGLDDEMTQRISKLILNALEADGLQGHVHIEKALVPAHRFNSVEQVNAFLTKCPDRFIDGSFPDEIVLDGKFTLEELDGLSYKIRGGK